MTNEEIAVELKSHEHEIKNLEYRMTEQEKQFKTLNELVISVKELAHNMKNMMSEQQKQGNKLKRLEDEPVERLNNAKTTMVNTIVSVLTGALVTGAIVLLAKYV